jgi:hypothetical protein
MTELHEPHGWLFDTRLKEFERQKQLRQQQRQQKQEEKVLLNEALDHLKQEHSIIEKISGAITDNELSSQSKNTYTSDQLKHIIKQKYFPPASNDQVNSVLTHLAEDHTNVAAQTEYHSPDRQVTTYQSRSHYKSYTWSKKQLFSLCPL